MYQSYNANPQHNRVGDCVIRGISTLLNEEWDKIYIDLCIQGLMQSDIPSSNAVWGTYLRDKGYTREVIPTECIDCYNVRRFCKEHQNGKYLLAISGHVVAVENGKYLDTWDSGDEIPIYYWFKKEEE